MISKIIYITHFQPNPIGHGGNHRSYQILEDLVSNFGVEKIYTIVIPLFANDTEDKHRRILYKSTNFIIRSFKIVIGLFVYFLSIGNINYVEKFNHIIEKLGWKIKFHKELVLIDKFIKNDGQNILGIVDHPFMECFVDLFNKAHIDSINCGHNLESLDTFLNHKSSIRSWSSSTNFSSEINYLSIVSTNWMISKVETFICKGLGANSQYYPYFPNGEIKKGLLSIRQERNQRIESKPFLLLVGSYSHLTTAESIDWLIKQILLDESFCDLNLRIVVVGNGTKKLNKKFNLPLYIEVKDWVPQLEFDVLCTDAKGALLPQLLGFGTVTRISEFSCAGIPSIISTNSAQSIDLPPGIITADNHWKSWLIGIKKILDNVIGNTYINDYLLWEANQKRLVSEIYRQSINNDD